MGAVTTPSEIARDTLRRLAANRLAPTPDNYGRVYRELAGQPATEDGGGAERDSARFLREQIAKVLTDAVVPRLGYNEELAREARGIAEGFRNARGAAELRDQAAALRQFWIHLELRGETQADLLASALALLQLAVRNFGELAPDERWLRPQLEKIEGSLKPPLELEAMRDAERGLREVIFRQGALRKSMDESAAALKRMAATFIDRLGALAASTGGYSERLAEASKKVEQAKDLTSLAGVMAQVLKDTRGVQADMLRTREELLEARRQAQSHEARVEQLEKELESVAALVRQDALTGVLNRRGLEEAFAAETARSERRAAPFSLAVLDLDNFKQLNDRLGHQAGDGALAHLARTVRAALRPSDTVARYGGEEFVILLPETACTESTAIMTRVQRELTRRFFLHDNQKVLITFSAGVAERRAGEPREALIERADRAMYEAKQAGKNRVCQAQ